MSVVDISAHDAAVLQALEVLDRPVGFAEAPEGALEAVRDRSGEDYVIVYPVSGTRPASSAADGDGDADLVYQTTVVAKDPMAARFLIQRIDQALRAMVVEGRAIVRFRPDVVGDVRRDDTVQPPVFIATPRWRVWTTPNP